ncbi:MAG TPA: hypothetical protein VFS41_02570 [Edaphobacter sp.]|nr:hypothetical protein [Edaphobacter sp.]
MFGKMIAFVALIGPLTGFPVMGQSVPQSALQSDVSGRVRVPAISEAQVARTSVVRPAGTDDEIVSLNCVALISTVAIKDNVVTFTAINQLAAGQEVSLSKLNRAIYLNGVTLKVLSATPTSFTARFDHPDVARIRDGGTALRTDCVAEGDYRTGQRVEVFRDNVNYFKRHLSPDIRVSRYDQYQPLEVDDHFTAITFNGQGHSWGNNGGWSVQKHRHEELTFNSRGIAQAHNLWCRKHAVGDVACGDYIYASTDGGGTAQSDEGFTVDTREGGESDHYFHGTAGPGASAGATRLPVVFSSGQEETTDGAYLIDISKGQISGIVSGLDSIVDGTAAHVLPVRVNSREQLTPSTGVGMIQTPLPIVAMANTPESIRLDVDLTRGSFKPGVACLAGGWYPEQVSITDVSAPEGSHQQVTLIHRNPNPTAATDPHNPSSLWQGGPCGSYLSLDRNLARDGFRTSYFVVGATDSNHIAYVWNVNGSTRQNGIQLYSPATKLTKLVRQGGLVTAHFANANPPMVYNHAPRVVIADAGDASFNGVASVPEYANDPERTLTWKQAGPDGATASATIDLPAESYGFHLYPGAEIIGAQVDHAVPLEPNSVAWQSGDVLENPHNPTFEMRFRSNSVTEHTPPSGSDNHGELWGFSGAGISSNFRPSEWVNTNPCTLYIGCGGTLQPITWTIHRGPYSILHRVDSAPMNGGILFRIGCDPLGCDHPAPYALFELQNGYITYDPRTSTVAAPALRSGQLSVDDASIRKLSLTSTPENGTDCLGVENHLIVTGSTQPKTAPCIASINWKGGNGLTVEQTGTPSHPVYTIVPEPGFYVPRSDGSGQEHVARTDSAVSISLGPANSSGSVRCMSGYACSSTRGRIELTAGRGATPGKIARVNASLSSGEICTATQNGGAIFLGIGSSGEGIGGFDITSGVGVAGKVVIDYLCR